MPPRDFKVGECARSIASDSGATRQINPCLPHPCHPACDPQQYRLFKAWRGLCAVAYPRVGYAEQIVQKPIVGVGRHQVGEDGNGFRPCFRFYMG